MQDESPSVGDESPSAEDESPSALDESPSAQDESPSAQGESSSVEDVVRLKYRAAALTILDGGAGAGGEDCCGQTRGTGESGKGEVGLRSGCCDPGLITGSGDRGRITGSGDKGEFSSGPVTGNLYDAVSTSSLPEEAVLASLGCGNPTALAELREGEVVLDLGSGGGIDVLLSGKRVGSTGKVYGLDMTGEMLALARRNAQKAGARNVEFLEGEMEDIPLPTESVDVVISNCVINLSTDKKRVLAEGFRVLKPGGRFAVSDMVARRSLPPRLRRSLELWAGCVAGALEVEEFLTLLRDVGFRDPTIEPTRIYGLEDVRGVLEAAGIDPDGFRSELEGGIMAAFVRARKPERGAE